MVVAVWTAGWAACAAWAWWRGDAGRRADWWDRRLQGATVWGRLRWLVFDRDGRRYTTDVTTTIVAAVLAAAAPVAVYPRVAVPALAAAVGWWVWRRVEPRVRERRGGWTHVTWRGRRQWAYCYGGFDRRTRQLAAVKFGHTAQPGDRRRRQVARTMPVWDVVELARGPGGARRERRFHRRLARFRYPGTEWFEANAETLAAAGELERWTRAGRRAVRQVMVG